MNRGGFLGSLAGGLTVAQVQPYTQTLRLAVVAPQSGPQRTLGRQLIDGVRGAVDVLNDRRFPNERALVYNAYDDHNAAADAVVQAGFASGSGDIVATIGHLGATPTLAALSVYGNAQMPLLVPTVTDDRITARGYRNVFRLPTKDSDEGGLVAVSAVHGGSKAPHVVTQDGDYGQAVADGFVRRAAALRVNALVTRFSVDKPDYAAAATAVLAGAPDSITLAGTVEDMGPLLPALRAQGYGGALFATQGFFDADTVKTYARAAQGMLVSTSVPYYRLAPTALRDVQDYEARNGALTPLAAYGYAAVQLVAAALRRTGAVTRIGMIRAFAGGGAFDTVTGSYTFTGTGDPLDPNVYFYAVRDGQFAYERQAHPSGFMLK